MPCERELGHVARERIVEANFALFEEAHDGWRGGEKFGERRQIENRADRHALAMRDERAFAECFAVNHMAAMADEEYAAGDFVVFYGGFDNGIEHGQVGARRFLLRWTFWGLRKQGSSGESDE